MTGNIRILLAQIATFEAQHRAGLNPPVAALAEFFDTARLARLDLEAFDGGMPLAEERPLRRQSASTPTFERVHGDVVELTARVPLSMMARAVLDQLTVLDERRLVRDSAPAARA